MCSPIGHTLAAAALGRRRLEHSGIGLWIFAVVFSNLPDIDFLFGALVGNPNRYHHLWTHSIAFALMSGLLFSVGFRMLKGDWNLRLAGLAFLFVFSHIVLDFFTRDTRPAFGVPLFWPLSGRFFLSPIAVFADLWRNSRTQTFIPSLFSRHNALAAVRETVIIGPVALWSWGRSLVRGGHGFKINRYFHSRSDL